MRRDGAGLAQHLAALDVFPLNTAQQDADVVAGLSLVEELAEHLDAGDDGLGRRANADDFDFFVDFHDALLDTAGDDGATAFDGEDVFDRHEERLVEVARTGSGMNSSMAFTRSMTGLRPLRRPRGP